MEMTGIRFIYAGKGCVEGLGSARKRGRERESGLLYMIGIPRRTTERDEEEGSEKGDEDGEAEAKLGWF